MKRYKLGTIHLKEQKKSAASPIEPFDLPRQAVLPLQQHIGAPAEALVAVGQRVVVGQPIGRATSLFSANIHASVSGRVVAIEPRPDLTGKLVESVVIDVEGDEWDAAIIRSDELVRGCKYNAEEIVRLIADAGIVGLGGATFPTNIKLNPPALCPIDTLIVNGAECEPYLTCDHRLMLEQAEEILVGITIMMTALGVKTAIIGIEANKPDAIALFEELVVKYFGITVVALAARYPQGGEKQLIATLTGRRVPSEGLPAQIGVVVQNVATAYAVYQAVQKNQPLIDRVVTVSGSDVAHPRNMRVRFGTLADSLFDRHDLYPTDDETSPYKLIAGGPMMGKTVVEPSAPVVKGTSGLLLLSAREQGQQAAENCIRCASCVEVCPMGLEPFLIARLAELKMHETNERHLVMDCIECGNCSYICPSHIRLLDFIRDGKAAIVAARSCEVKAS